MTGDAQYLNLPILSTFLKYFARTYIGPKNDSEKAVPDGVQELVPVEIQTKMRELFTDYFNSASKTLVKGQVVSPSSLNTHPSRTHARNSSSRTNATTKPTSDQARSLKIDSMPTKR